MPGIEAVLRRLAVPFCLATSSSPERVARSLRIVGLDGLFEGKVTTAVEVRNGKPAPDLFLLAAGKQGVAPERCLVIEDSLAGVRAGLAAGMKVWHFVGGGHLAGLEFPTDPEVRPHAQIASFGDFFDSAPELERSHPR